MSATSFPSKTIWLLLALSLVLFGLGCGGDGDGGSGGLLGPIGGTGGIGPGGGGGSGNLPAPAGGNAVGDWTLDYLIFPTIQNDSVKFEVTGGTASGSTNMTQTNFLEQLDFTIYMHVEQLVNSQWQAVNDTGSYQEQTEGTYTTQGTNITLNFTSPPEMAGETVTVPYTAETNRLIFYRTMTYGTIEFEMDVVYKHP